MGITRKMLLLVVISCMLNVVIIPAYADELDEHRKMLQDVSRQINQQRNNLNIVVQKEKTVIGQIKSLDTNILKTENELNNLCDKIETLEKSIISIEKEIGETEQELSSQVGILRERIVFIHDKGDVSYLEVLLGATDIKDFINRFDMLNIIVEQDMKLIENINYQKQVLNTKKSDLEVRQKELAYAKESQKDRQKTLAIQRVEKQQVLGSVQQEKDDYNKLINELEKTSQELETMIRKIQAGSSGGTVGTGTYTWPTPGYTRTTSPYGMRYHPILKSNRMHTGVDIGAPSGANIVAVDDGSVIYCGSMGGYGLVVVIDHSNGLSTLYAHQSKILVTEGQSVTKGQTIGKVGSTGWSTGPHLHFEARIDGKCTNPMPYLK